MRKITAEWNKEHLACYPDERLARLYDRPMELREVLARKDGPWDDVSAEDRMWVFWRAATQAQRATTLDRIITRAVTNHCLDCGIDAVEQWAARWLSGEDRSGKAAMAAVWAARAVRAAKAAARAAEWAVEAERATERAEWAECAEWAEWSEWSEAERDLQLLDALDVLDNTQEGETK